MGQTITGIQHRESYRHSSRPYSDYNYPVVCHEFVVERTVDGERVHVTVFFPDANAPTQGVGLQFPSTSLAIAVGRALLSVAEGYVSKATGQFLEQAERMGQAETESS